MIDQYFGVKELYEVVLKAKTSMQFGARRLEPDEPVLYFEKVQMSNLTERSNPIMARGGWLNMPHVVWEDRSEVQFSITEGVLSNVSMGILLSANVATKTTTTLAVPKREGPFELINQKIYLQHWPIAFPTKKTFIYEYERDVAQKKVYGKRILGEKDPWDDSIERPCLQIYQDKECTIDADSSKEYIVDYYYEYTDEALIYSVKKERFNGLFTLEGKFYVKDETEGLKYTNLIYMPKVRVVSDINLRLGERADPTVSTFHIIGLPENLGSDRNGTIMEITHLNADIDEDL